MTIPRFRAWFKKGRTTLDVATIEFLEKEVKSYANVMYKFDEVELMQFTGLKDKNGKEIFEGDIVLIYGEKISKVFYSQGSFCVDILNGGTPLHGFSSKQLEVIGNVWENKELVEEEND